MGDSKTSILTYVYMGNAHTSQQWFPVKPEETSPSVSSSNKTVNALDCEN